MPNLLATNVDRIVSVEIRGPGVPRGVMPRLHEEVRARVGRPLSLTAAELLAQRLHKDDTVLILTGAGDPVWLPKGETDGPIGAAGLGRALDLGLGARPVFVCTRGYEEPIAAAAEAAGLSILPWELCAQRHHATLVETFPITDEAASLRLAGEILDRYRPAMLIAIEVKGPNKYGDLAYMSGRSATGEARLDALFQVARQRGIPTLGIGDGGNELGFGDHTAAVEAVHPHGGRIACVTPADALMVAAISNWGAYGIEAMLAALLRRPEVMHPAQVEAEMIRAAVRAGAGDGIHTRQVAMVDGLSIDVHVALVEILGHMVRTALGGVEYALS